MSALDTSVWLCGPPPSSGQKQRFPSRFLYNLKKAYPITQKTLWMFSGSIQELGDTTDIRPETGAKFVCPYDDLIAPRNHYDMVIADPPYTVGFSQEFVSSLRDVPKPKRILREATKVTVMGGLILILHIIIIPAYKEFGVRRIALHPIFCGPNNSIRVLNVFRRF